VPKSQTESPSATKPKRLATCKPPECGLRFLELHHHTPHCPTRTSSEVGLSAFSSRSIEFAAATSNLYNIHLPASLCQQAQRHLRLRVLLVFVYLVVKTPWFRVTVTLEPAA